MRVNPRVANVRVANAAREPGTAREAASPRPRRAFPGYLREAADPDGGCGAVPDPHGGHGDAIRSRRGRQGRWWGSVVNFPLSLLRWLAASIVPELPVARRDLDVRRHSG